jgi:predicted MFS family arabinose efflux permease
MLIWQFANNYAVFAVYCVLYGLTGGGFVSLLPVTTAEIVGVENIQKGLGMAFMTAVVGSLVGTPIVGLLVSSYGWTAAIQFAGGITMAAAICILTLRIILSEGKIFVKV